jgi:chromosome segregation ATPase
MAIESEVEVLKSVVSKIDHSIEKITQVSNDIGKILAVHEARLDGLEKIADSRNDDIKELHSRITTQHREMLDKIEAMEDRLELKMQQGQFQATKQHEDIQKELQSDIGDLSKRLTVLENWRWWILGAAAAVGFMVAKMPNILPI